MLRNQAQALLRHERIRTTVPKAKELRPFVERLITIAKRGIASGEALRVVHARRLVRRDIADQDVLSKLFEGIAPRFEGRPGGYTRLLRFGARRGDAAEMAQVELVGSEYSSAEDEDEVDQPVETAPAKPKGVGGRLRAVARRMRGKDAEVTSEAAAARKPKKKRTTPKKAKKRSS